MKRSSVLISAVAGMIIGGITLGGIATASSGPVISGTVVANQGTGTGAGGAWKVDGSGVTQPVSGAVTVTPSTPYFDACQSFLSNQCETSLLSGPVLVKDVSISIELPTGDFLNYCEVLAIPPSRGPAAPISFIPMFEQSAAPVDEAWTGNSQVDIAVPAGWAVGASCNAAEIAPAPALNNITATFQGDVTS